MTLQSQGHLIGGKGKIVQKGIRIFSLDKRMKNFFFANDRDEIIDDARIKLRAAIFFQDLDCFFERHGFSIGAIGGHGIKRVSDRHDPSHLRNLLFF